MPFWHANAITHTSIMHLKQKYIRRRVSNSSTVGTWYNLTVGGYSGNASDALAYHNGKKFFTRDNDNDYNCAQNFLGAWWYDNCFTSSLNGIYSSRHGMASLIYLNSQRWKFIVNSKYKLVCVFWLMWLLIFLSCSENYMILW